MNIILVDLSNVFHVMWYAGTNKDARWPYTQTMGRIRALAQEYDAMAIMVDGKRSFRKDVDPRWKAKREEKEAGLWALLAETERTLDAEGFHLFKVDNLEADDLMATAVHQLLGAEFAEPISVTINSGDKDMLGLLEPGVQILTTVAPHKIIVAEQVRASEKVGVDPARFRDWQVLTDDHNDVNYVPGVGPKNAARLLNQYGSLEKILAALDNQVPDSDQFEIHPPKVRAALKKALSETVNGRPLFDVAVEVMTLRRDAPIDITEIFKKKARRAVESESWDEDGGDQSEGERGRADRTERADDDEERADAGGVAKTGTGCIRGAGVQPAGGESELGPATVPEPRVSHATSGQDASAEQRGQEGGGGHGGGMGAPAVRQAVVASEPVVANEIPRQNPSAPSAGAQAPMILAPKWELSLEPTSTGDAYRLAQQADRCGFWPKHGGVAGCLMIILAGRSRGLSAWDSLNGMHIIEGRPCFAAYTLIGLVRRSKLCVYLDVAESSSTSATWITKRKGSKIEQKRTYTIQDAERAKLLRAGSGWEKNPEDLLIKSAGAKLVRFVYSDITSGAVAAEEMGYE